MSAEHLPTGFIGEYQGVQVFDGLAAAEESGRVIIPQTDVVSDIRVQDMLQTNVHVRHRDNPPDNIPPGMKDFYLLGFLQRKYRETMESLIVAKLGDQTPDIIVISKRLDDLIYGTGFTALTPHLVISSTNPVKALPEGSYQSLEMWLPIPYTCFAAEPRDFGPTI